MLLFASIVPNLEETYAADFIVFKIILGLLDIVSADNSLVAVVIVLLVCDKICLAQELLLVMFQFSDHIDECSRGFRQSSVGDGKSNDVRGLLVAGRAEKKIKWSLRRPNGTVSTDSSAPKRAGSQKSSRR